MKKIKLFFKRIENCFVFMDYLTCCLLLILVIACATSGFFAYADLNQTLNLQSQDQMH